MDDTRILIIDQDIDMANYFKRVIKMILPKSKITITSNIDEIADKNIFSVIILDSREAFLKIDTQIINKVIICSLDSDFVQQSISRSYSVILRSRYFYGAVYYQLMKKEIV
jgi:hypothetical protein